VSQTGTITTNHVVNMLREPTGLPFAVEAAANRAAVTLAEVEPSRILSQNVAHELAERTAGAQYPSVSVYCEKISNLMTEKFRTFSGKARMVVDIRVSQDRLEGIEALLELYAEAVTDVLDSHRGCWGGGMFYAGGYEVTFGGVKHGGRNFIQSAKASFEVDISLG
jgi:hypothetical protein